MPCLRWHYLMLKAPNLIYLKKNQIVAKRSKKFLEALCVRSKLYMWGRNSLCYLRFFRKFEEYYMDIKILFVLRYSFLQIGPHNIIIINKIASKFFFLFSLSRFQSVRWATRWTSNLPYVHSNSIISTATLG